MKTCPACQKLVNDDTKFCYYCGASLMAPAPEPAPESEPIPDPVPKPVAEVVPESVVEPEPETEAVPDPAAAVVPEPVAAPEPEAISEPEPNPAPVAEPEPVPVPVPVPRQEQIVIPAAAAHNTPTNDVPPIAEPPRTEVPPTPEKPEVVVNATDSRSLMTTAGYFFSTILFHIPIIGWIFLFAWGCGRPKNISRKRFALAWLIMRLICVILFLSCTVFVLIAFSGKLPMLGEALANFFS